jgi:hypothetical protein
MLLLRFSWGLTLLLLLLLLLLPLFAASAADTRRSAACFVGWCSLFLPWMVLFMAAGSSLLNAGVYAKLDAYRIDLASWGIGF